MADAAGRSGWVKPYSGRLSLCAVETITIRRRLPSASATIEELQDSAPRFRALFSSPRVSAVEDRNPKNPAQAVSKLNDV